jgi:hypothetical protein
MLYALNSDAARKRLQKMADELGGELIITQHAFNCSLPGSGYSDVTAEYERDQAIRAKAAQQRADMEASAIADLKRAQQALLKCPRCTERIGTVLVGPTADALGHEWLCVPCAAKTAMKKRAA